MLRSTQVSVLDRLYPLRVRPEDEVAIHRIAAFVDERMRAVRDQLPDRPELTTAVVAALSIAEELFSSRETSSVSSDVVNARIEEFIAQLDDVLQEPGSEPSNGES